jgi:hypothetical protein
MVPSLPREAAWIMVAVFVFCTVGIIVGLSLPTNHDEFQYIAAAHLYGQFDIYRDFFHSQTPYFPIALHYWNILLSDLVGSLYVSSRLFNVFWSLLFACTFLYVLARLSPDSVLSIGVFAILFTSQALDLPLRVVRNDMMPLALTSSAMALMARSYFREGRHARWGLSHFLAGTLLAAAVSSKHSYAVVALALALGSLISPGFSVRDNWKRATLPFIAGGLVGAIPLLYFIANNWETMRFSLIEFHQTAHVQQFLERRPLAVAEFSLKNRAARLAYELFNLSFLASLIVFSAFVIALLVVGGRMRDMSLPHWRMLSISILAIVLTVPALLLVHRLHPQYVAPLVPFVGICIVSAAAMLKDSVDWRSARSSSRIAFAGAGAFLLAVALYNGLVKTDKGAIAHLKSMMSFDPAAVTRNTTNRRNFHEVWATEHYSRVARRLVDVLGRRSDVFRVATIMTPYPLEAGYEIYPEFAGAPFFYRSNDHLSSAKRLKYVGVSPLTVRNWLDETRAEALLVGYDPQIEVGFWDYARAYSFACFRIDLSGAYNFHAGGSRVAFLLVSPSRTDATPDCTVDASSMPTGSTGDR